MSHCFPPGGLHLVGNTFIIYSNGPEVVLLLSSVSKALANSSILTPPGFSIFVPKEHN